MAEPSVPRDPADDRRDLEAHPDITRLTEFLQGPLDVRSLSTTGLFLLAVMYTIYVARPVLMPVTLAVLFSFLLSPAVASLERLRVSPKLGAALVLMGLIGLVAVAAVRLADPAAEWLARLPGSLDRAMERIRELTGLVEEVTENVEEITQVGERSTPRVEVDDNPLIDRVFSSSRSLVAGTTLMLALTYFLLASGDLFMRKLVKVIPRLSDKKRAVELARRVRRQASTYLFTVTSINVGLAVVQSVAMYALGMPNPVLWGVLAGFLNYVPYLGQTAAAAAVGVAALLSLDTLGHAFGVLAVYVTINGLEGSVVTPYLVGYRLQLNPVAVFVAVLFWGWMWGLVGAVLAVPLLATLKILCDTVEPLQPIGEFLGA